MKHLILDYIVGRKEVSSDLPFEYDHTENLNIVSLADGSKLPFIDLDTLGLEAMTTTKVARESNDDSLVLELMTKTFTNRERDDDRKELLLEMMTKTRLQRESDDEHSVNYQ